MVLPNAARKVEASPWKSVGDTRSKLRKAFERLLRDLKATGDEA